VLWAKVWPGTALWFSLSIYFIRNSYHTYLESCKYIYIIFKYYISFMAWHSKRHNIKHRKAAQDAKKSKFLAQASKQIQLAAKQGADPDLNPALASALTKARQVGLGKDAMQKAIDKGAWNIEGEELVEIYYEWYGPNGIAMYIKCITPNTNRSASNVKAILTKYGGNMWEPWSVSWQFTQIGELVIDGRVRIENEKGNEVEYIDPLDEHEFEIAVMESGASDYEIEDNSALVTTLMEDWVAVDKRFTQHQRHASESWLTFIAENTLQLDEKWEEKLQKLIDVLEEDDDVDTVWHNAG